MRKSFLLMILAVLTACSPMQSGSASMALEGGVDGGRAHHDWLLSVMGQSNAMGQANTLTATVSLDTMMYDFIATTTTLYTAETLRWMGMRAYPNWKHSAEIGFILSAAANGERVQVQRWAVASTALSRWLKDANDLYPLALAEMRDAASTYPCLTGPYNAHIWWQGEADSRDAVLASTYGARLIQFTEDLRTDIGLPDLPIVAMRLRADAPGTYVELQRDSLVNVWAASRPGVNLWVDLDDLPVGTDKVHYAAPSLTEAGNRAYAAVVAAGF